MNTATTRAAAYAELRPTLDEDLRWLDELELRLRETNRIGGVNAPFLEQLVAMIRGLIARLEAETRENQRLRRGQERRR